MGTPVYCRGILTCYLFELLYYIASEGYCFARQNATNRKQFITDGMSNTKHSINYRKLAKCLFLLQNSYLLKCPTSNR